MTEILPENADFQLFSDGGSSAGGVAAGACILQGKASGRRRGSLVYLGEATNNEAEIAAALLGFSFIRLALNRRGVEGGVSIYWVSDSEYVLKSAGQYIQQWQRNGWKTANKKPVKNQGLWRAYLHLSEGFQVVREHVRGHTGHPENELCDTGANWVKDYAEEELRKGNHRIMLSESKDLLWFLIDGREFLKNLRDDGESEETFLLLEKELSTAISAEKK